MLAVFSQGSGQNIFISVSALEAGPCAVDLPVHLSLTSGESSSQLDVSCNAATGRLTGRGGAGNPPRS